MERFDDIFSPEAIKSYFEELYTVEGEVGMDINNTYKEMEKGAEGCNFNFNFRQVAEKFKLIEENTVPIIVEYDECSRSLINILRFTEEYRTVLRSLQDYTVNVYENEFSKMYGAGMLEVIDDGIYVLRDMNMYKRETGLEFVLETGIGVFV